MSRSCEQLRSDLLAIWRAGLEAVDSGRLMRAAVAVAGRRLSIAGESIDLDQVVRIAVVGAGKAGAGMSAALEEILGPDLMREKQLAGWVNVPADCVRRLERIHLHPARPAGSNEPTPEGFAGSLRILEIVSQLGPRDLCICLISGGASALLPAPIEGVSLDQKLAVTRLLAAGGANIRELNTVRKQLSRIKGGRLAAACGAGRLTTLIISDVLGDPLDVIGSGPTVPDSSTAAEAAEILRRYGGQEHEAVRACIAHLEEAPRHSTETRCALRHAIIGNNAVAVAAAERRALELGYPTQASAATQLEGEAEPIGRELAEQALRLRASPGRHCIVSGGEPVVRLADDSIRGLGGRNQQLALAAAQRLWNEDSRGIAILSGGTDGEDGPTDAAGAWIDAEALDRARRLKLDPADYLARNDAYRFFEQLGALLRTGPTHTNVCDLRVAVIDGD